ncbi:hypothetical protein SH139x_000277 [Planctomycetaceae bacterium SH139]
MPAPPADDFGQFLQQQRLGKPIYHSGELLYQCGYAAGMATANRQSHATIKRWQCLGLAAATIVCMLIGRQLFPTTQTPNAGKTAQIKTPVPVETTLPPAQLYKQEQDSLLAQQQADNTAQPSVLSASPWQIQLTGLPATTAESIPTVPNQSNKILRPSDYHLLIQGDV